MVRVSKALAQKKPFTTGLQRELQKLLLPRTLRFTREELFISKAAFLLMESSRFSGEI